MNQYSFKIELVQKVVLGLFFAFFSCFICATERMSITCHSISLKLGGQKQPATLHLSLNTTQLGPLVFCILEILLSISAKAFLSCNNQLYLLKTKNKKCITQGSTNWTILCLTCFLKGTSEKWDFINKTAIYELALPFSLSQHNNILHCP